MRIVFFGTPSFAVASLDALIKGGYNVVGVVTAEDKPANRGHKISISAVKEYALEHNLLILQPKNLKDETFIKNLQKLNADLHIVVAFRMLPKIVYAMPKYGTFNLHGSLLPKYRGAAPIHWAIINGEKETGLTTFLLNDKIDEGEVLFQTTISIGNNETTGELHDKMMIEGGKLVTKTVDAIKSGNYTLIPQSKIGISPSLAPKIFKDNTLINWQKKGEEIVNFVRGMSPIPCASAVFFDSKTDFELFLKVFAVKFHKKIHEKKSGLVEVDNCFGIIVYCEDGFIEIIDLQASGKKRMSTKEYLRGNKLEMNLQVK